MIYTESVSVSNSLANKMPNLLQKVVRMGIGMWGTSKPTFASAVEVDSAFWRECLPHVISSLWDLSVLAPNISEERLRFQRILITLSLLSFNSPVGRSSRKNRCLHYFSTSRAFWPLRECAGRLFALILRLSVTRHTPCCTIFHA